MANTLMESYVFQFLNSASHAILLDRYAVVQPMISGCAANIDCAEYIRQTIHGWRRQITRPMNIDLYLFNNTINSHILLERWSISYQSTPDSFETVGNVNFLQARIQTLIRSLHSFVRLLPGFNLLTVSRERPLITMQIYDPKIEPVNFKHEFSRYSFPGIPMTRGGGLTVSVCFTNPAVVKDILRAINGGVLVGLPSPSYAANNKDAKGAGGDVKQHSAAIPIPSQQQQPQSVKSPANAAYEQRGRVVSDSKDHHRRSFQIKDPEMMYGIAGTSAGSHSSRSMDSRFASMAAGGEGYFPGSTPPKGYGVYYPGTSPAGQSNSNRMLPHTPSFSSSYNNNTGTTPAFAFLQQQYQQQQQYANTSEAGTSLGSAGGNMMDMIPHLHKPSPPYPQISSSLNSTSPHFGPSPSMMTERRPSYRSRQNSGSLSTFQQQQLMMLAQQQQALLQAGSQSQSQSVNHHNSNNAMMMMISARQQDMLTSTDIEMLKLNITLPISPFIHSKHRSHTDSAMDANSIYSTEGGSNNKLDIVMKLEKDRERRNSDVYFSEARSRSISETTKEEDTLDKLSDGGLDDDMPFAWRPPQTSGLSITSNTATTTTTNTMTAPILALLSRNNRAYAGAMTASDISINGTPLFMLSNEVGGKIQEMRQFASNYIVATGQGSGGANSTNATTFRPSIGK